MLQTVISDIEVKYEDAESELVSFRYGDGEDSIVVVTIHVETTLGSVAIAVHPENERYTHLAGKALDHPLRKDLKIQVIADDYVDCEFGTGAVKITSVHDPNDFTMGQRHDLDMPEVIDTTGRTFNTGTCFDGMDRTEARTALTEALREQGRIVKETHLYVHLAGHPERSGEPIKPLLSLQWFVKVDELAKISGDAIREGDTVIYPTSQEPRWFDWVDDVHDWCISRQLWRGHRIPIWYGPNGEVVYVGPDDEAPTDEGWTQDPDILDTWFSSALWPFSTMGQLEATPELEKFYPISVLVTGYDILFLWVACTMMFSTSAVNLPGSPLSKGRSSRPQVSLKDVFLYGLVRDGQGRKMSESLGNGIGPLDRVRDYGVDALRLTLAHGANPGSDLSVGNDAAQSSRNFATKLFSAIRFALMNGAHMGELSDRDQLIDTDRWILDRLEQVCAEVDSALDRYEFPKASEASYHFAWNEVCDWHLEMTKVGFPRLNDGEAMIEEQAAHAVSTRLVLSRVLDTLLRLLHPSMPFITETLWKAFTDGAEGFEDSLAISAWPGVTITTDDAAVDEVVARRIADAQKLVTELCRFRNDQGVKPSQCVPVRMNLVDADLATQEEMIRSLTRAEAPEDGFTAIASIEVRLSQAAIPIGLDASSTVDVTAERKRLEKDLVKAEKELVGTERKLGNEAFLPKTPEQVVGKIKTRHQFALEEIDRIKTRLEGLPQA